MELLGADCFCGIPVLLLHDSNRRLPGVCAMNKYRYWAGILAATFLGMFFIVAGAGKLMAQSSNFQPFIAPAYLPQAIIDVAYSGLPYIEVIIGLLLICGIAIRFTSTISAILIACFIASNLYLLSIGVGTCGSCFGVLGGLTVYAALALDVIMAVLVVIIFTCQRGRYLNMSPWFITSGHTVTRCA